MPTRKEVPNELRTPGSVKYLPLLGVGSAPAQTSRSLEDRLLGELEAIETVNTHEHIIPESERVSQKIDFFTLAGHYAINDLISAGLSQEAVKVINDVNAPEATRWRAFEPGWKMARFTGYGQALRIAVRDIYGVEEISASSLGAINNQIRARNNRDSTGTCSRSVHGFDFRWSTITGTRCRCGWIQTCSSLPINSTASCGHGAARTLRLWSKLQKHRSPL